MAIINSLRRKCVQMIRRLLEALKLADHVPFRQLDEEQVMMAYCQVSKIIQHEGCSIQQ